MKERHLIFLLIGVIIIFFCIRCTYYKILKPSLDPSSQKFLDRVRYIITAKEEKMFKEIPPENRDEFIEDFWKRRDPKPKTEVNEFRQQYYIRMAVANKTFSCGLPGWKTDRGRIYILLGPPTDVIKKSMGGAGDTSLEFKKGERVLSSNLLEKGTFTQRPTEIWVYNQYPDYFSGPLRLVFVDYESNGDYKLSSDVKIQPFSMIFYVHSNPDLIRYQQVGEIEKDESRPQILPFLDFSKSLGEIKKNKQKNYTVNCFFEIPFNAVGYHQKNSYYIYDLEIGIKVKSVENKSTYREKKNIKGKISLNKLKNRIKENYSHNIKMTVPLEKGTNKIYFSVRDNVNKKILRKLDILKIKE